MFRITEGFGSGMGGLKDTCGAVTGMFLIISLYNSAGDLNDPKKTKMDTYKKFREAAAAFEEKNRSIYCRDLEKYRWTSAIDLLCAMCGRCSCMD